MKTILLVLLVTLTSFIFSNEPVTQLRVNVNVNIGSKPPWGPRGYDDVGCYYLPDIDCYYPLPCDQFVYISGGN